MDDTVLLVTPGGMATVQFCVVLAVFLAIVVAVSWIEEKSK